MYSVENVMRVYSGKAGHCCCGCSGEHVYNSKFVEEAGSEKVSDQAVKRIVSSIKKI